MRFLILLLFLLGVLFANPAISIRYSKREAFLNEPIVAKVYIKSTIKPRYITFEGFKQKELYAKEVEERNITSNPNGWYSKTYYYLLFPQATGDIEIPKLTAKVMTIQKKTGFTITNKVTSKPFTLKIDAIPEGLALSGNLAMHLTQSGKVTKVNKPIDFTLIIEGRANIDDIKPFHLRIKGATLYSDTPQRVYKVVKGKPFTKFTQHFTVVSDKSYSVAPLKLNYFNTETRLKEQLATKRLHVTIDKPLLTIRELLSFLAGVFVGLLLLFFLYRIKQKSVPSDLELAIKRAKNDRELYNLLLPYANREEYREKIKELEARLFRE